MIEKVMEILRFFYEQSYSRRRISIVTGVPKSTVSDYLKRFQDACLRRQYARSTASNSKE